MYRTKRYAAVLVAVAVTGGLSLDGSPDGRAVLLLAAVAQTSAVATAVALRYPDAWRGNGNLWSALFAGVTTFGVFALLNGVEPTPNLPVAALGFGLAWVGFAVGIAFERDSD